MNNEEYIIDKLFVDVDTNNVKTGNFIKNNISSFLQDDLLPQIESVFEKYDLNGTVIRFNELQLDLSVGEWKDIEILKVEICKGLEEKLRTEISFAQRQNGHELGKDVVRKISPEKDREDVFLFFLENGYLPWFGKQEQIGKISQIKILRKSLNDEYFLKRLQDLLIQDDKALNRLILQFPHEILLLIVSKIDKDFKKSDRERVSRIVNELSSTGAQFFLNLLGYITLRKEREGLSLWQKSLDNFLKSESKLHDKSEEKIRKELWLLLMKFQPELISDLNLKDWLQTGVFNKQDARTGKDVADVTQKQEEYFDERTNEVSVFNAGLIILHPFFTSFFNELQIIGLDKQIIAEKKELALQALHYLATGEEDFFEGNLMIEKFICGIPLNWPVQRESLLNESIKKEANVLLEQTIKHWSALKNTSVDGLRQLFLQRNGKLMQNENKFKLIVERKAQDILLEKLDWNISLIKLPWSKQLLYVDW